jgi:ribonuclease R
LETAEKILSFMREQAYKPLTFEELMEAFEIPRNQAGFFMTLIDQLESDGRIVKTRRGRYGIPEKMNLVVGRLQGHEKRFGFLIPDNPETPDLFIPFDSLNGAMHNDRIMARISQRGYDGRRAEGEVIRILERANKTVVGTFESGEHFGFVVPDDKRIFFDIYIDRANAHKARTGHKVVVKIDKWPEKRRNPEGIVIEILGKKGAPGLDVLSIIRKYELSEEFPADVLNQAEQISDVITPDELEGRLDLRSKTIVTIDGEDAKDLDDAVSVEKQPDGSYLLGVHIADLSYYVKEGTPLDLEARNRGCSVYLVDRVLPMLPPKLSNGICSLNPNVDRLTMSVIIQIDRNGKVLNYNITPSVIKTVERMTYTNVTHILDGTDSQVMERYSYLTETFRQMHELSEILRRRRLERGSIDFDLEEAKVILDEKGRPIDIKREERTVSHRIIEEFMLACNEVIAEHVHWLNLPFVYRIHEAPDPEKIMGLVEFLHNLGYTAKGIRDLHPKTLQEILEWVKGRKEERIISHMLLRSLKQARYSSLNVGHFGLATKFYTHFTAPIRRYPDLVIHRIIRELLDNSLDERRQKKLNKLLTRIAKTSSERERVAVDAERESADMKKVEFMADKIGETFNGIISGITAFGMFVELENTVEGLVHVSNMVDDYYHFDEARLTLNGERTNKSYHIGDQVTVRLLKADIESRQIDFELY